MSHERRGAVARVTAQAKAVRKPDADRAARAVERLRAQADALRAMFPVSGPVPDHIKQTIAEKLRAASALEAVYGEPSEEES